MKTFEILPVGFNGGTDELDHKVLWINAPNKDNVTLLLDRMSTDYKSVNEIDYMDGTIESSIDFVIHHDRLNDSDSHPKEPK